MLKTRNKLVNFRVTEEEYDDLRAACLSRGARCLSDYARTVILRSTPSADGGREPEPAGVTVLHDRIGDVERRITLLETNLDRLLSAVGSAAAAS